MSQSLMRTSRHRSRSIPSLLGSRRSLRIRSPDTRTSAQPERRSVHKAPSRRVTSRTVTFVQWRRNTVNGRWAVIVWMLPSSTVPVTKDRPAPSMTPPPVMATCSASSAVSSIPDSSD